MSRAAVGGTAAQRTEQELEDFYSGLKAHQVAPLWKSLKDLVPDEPKSQAVPHVWRYAPLREQLMRAGDLVSAEDAERRVLMLLNPSEAIAERAGTTNSLYVGMQLVLPGEVARTHRHAASAFRFVIEASTGAFTNVEGERVMMAPGDLVLTPNWYWHDHGNESDEPVIWMDGLDLPVVSFFEGHFFELYPEMLQPVTRADNSSTRQFGTARLNPTWRTDVTPFSPIFNYRWADTERALRTALEEGLGSPYDGALFEYAHPFSNGPVMPTLNCYAQGLAPSAHTQAHQHTTSTVYHVVRGGGTTIVDGEELRWQERDVFCVPGWSVHEHINASSTEPAMLFSLDNRSIYEQLGLYRERAVKRQG